MKFLAVLLLAIATVQATSLQYYGWTPSKETVFKVESQLLSGIREIRDSHLAGMRLTAFMRVQAFRDFSLRIQIEQPEFVTINGEVNLTPAGRLSKEQDPASIRIDTITKDIKTFLQQPFVVFIKNGMVETFEVAKDEPTSVTNIKKALLSQLQLDVTGSGRTATETNHILPKATNMTFFSTTEQTVQGDCLTDYTIHKLPLWRVKEMEQEWMSEEILVSGKPSKLTPASVQCQGKQHFIVTKTTNFEQCKSRPIFTKLTGVSSDCDITKETCGPALTHACSTTVIVCGQLNEFVIRKVMHEDVLSHNMFIDQEAQSTITNIVMDIIDVQPIRKRLPITSPTKVIDTLVFAYPGQPQESALDAQIVNKTEELLGVRPILPQPGLTEAPSSLIPVTMSTTKIVTEVFHILKTMAVEIFQSPEHCTSQSDLAGTYGTLFNFMRQLSMTELESLEEMVIAEPTKSIETLFYQTLSEVGTNPSTMLIIKKVKTGTLPTAMLAKLISHSIRSVRYPTMALMTELVKMVKLETVQADSHIFTTTLAHLSNLIYTAYVNPTTMVTSFPTRVYGLFGNSESTVITGDLIPFLIKTLETTESEHIRLVVISSIGKLGHLDGLKPLLKVKEHLKPVAIFSMKHIALMNPVQVRPLLMAIITNPVESADIRIAATAILPYTDPSVAELQRLAVMSWFEPSKQVTSFVISTLRSLATTVIPDLKTVGIKAESTLSLLKTETFGIQYSKNTIISQFVTYLKSVVAQKMVLIQSKESVVPRFFSLSTFVGPAGTSFQGHSFEAYTSGMDYLLEKFSEYVMKSGETTGPIRKQLDEIIQELTLKTSQIPAPMGFFKHGFFGMESSFYLDTETALAMVANAAEKLETTHSFNISHITSMNLVETTFTSVSSNGFSIVNSARTPIIIALQGSIITEPAEGKLLPKIITKILPVFHGKLQSVLGVVSPITQELVATGFEMSLHTSLPVEIEADVAAVGEIEVIVRNPTEVLQSNHSVEAIHAQVIPFTATVPMTTVTPLMSLPTMKTIKSGNQISKLAFPLGTSLGLSTHIQYQSDVAYTDLFSYLEKIKVHSPASFITTAFFPSTLRHSSAKVTYNPALSPAKELKFSLRLTTTPSASHPFAPVTSGPINNNKLAHFPTIVRSLIKLRPNLVSRSSSSASVVEIIASSTGPSFSKTTSVGVMAGMQQITTGMTTKVTKVITAIEIVPMTGSRYIFGFDGKIVLPVMMNKWNIQQLLNEALQVAINGKLSLGKSASPTAPVEIVDVEMDAVMEKTEALKTSILSSVDFETCRKDIINTGGKLTPVCQLVRQQAASLDSLKVTLKTPTKLTRSALGLMAGDILRSIAVSTFSYGGSLSHGDTHLPTLEGFDTMEIELTADRESTLAQATVNTPSLTYAMNNIRLQGTTKGLFPLTVQDTLSTTITRRLTGDLIPSTCHVEPTFIRTFDNKTINYPINDCEHVLLVDGSGSFPIAVSTRTTGNQKKAVTIISGISKVVMVPSISSMVITINGQPITIPSGEVVIEKTSNGVIAAIIKRFADNVFEVTIPRQMLVVRSDGVSVEVVAPQLLKSRTLGLCGDMNGEITADLKTPRRCIMEPRLAAISFMLNKSGSRSSVFPTCSGAPAKVLREFEAMNRICPQESVIPTPVLNQYESLTLGA